MTKNGPGRPSCPENPFVVLLLLEKEQQASTGHQGGWSRVSPPVLQSSGSVPHFSAGAQRQGRTSWSESGMGELHKLDQTFKLEF